MIFTVTDLTDDINDVHSLRGAINAANNHANHGGADRIFFRLATAAPNIIHLGSVINITDALTIIGPGSNKVIIDGGGTTQLLHIDDSGVTGGGDTHDSPVSISGLAFVRGNTNGNNAGGAIFTKESLTLKNSLVSGNTTGTGGAYAGGGIYANAVAPGGSVSISNTVITGNYAGGRAGGAYLEATKSVKLTGCVISGNSVGSAIGGVYARVPSSATGGPCGSASTFTGMPTVPTTRSMSSIRDRPGA